MGLMRIHHEETKAGETDRFSHGGCSVGRSVQVVSNCRRSGLEHGSNTGVSPHQREAG